MVSTLSKPGAGPSKAEFQQLKAAGRTKVTDLLLRAPFSPLQTLSASFEASFESPWVPLLRLLREAQYTPLSRPLCRAFICLC